MLVKFIRHKIVHLHNYVPGDFADLDEEMAKTLIEHKVVVPATKAEQALDVETSKIDEPPIRQAVMLPQARRTGRKPRPGSDPTDSSATLTEVPGETLEGE